MIMKIVHSAVFLMLFSNMIIAKSASSVNSPGIETLPYKMDNGIKVFHLTPMVVTRTIYDKGIDKTTPFVKPENRLKNFKEMPFNIPSKKITGYGFNGSIPGPTIVVNEGDRVRIIVENKLPEPTSVHWHGLIVPNSEDGAGATTQPVIAPGKTFTYEFKVKQNGTFMYHSGFNDIKQVQKGMGGMFVALPKDKKIDKDYAILLQMFTLPENDSNPIVFTMDPSWFTFNGLVMPNFPVLEAKMGEKVRIRFGNLSMSAHPIHLHGYSFKVVGTEGGAIPESAQWPAATININPGETRDIEFVADNPGLWRLHCHKILHISNDTAYWKTKQPGLKLVPLGGMYTYLSVSP
ncbi:multicopper oxidase [Legionella nautarum]|uniref:Copper-containing nitrite reductase n=1 Tax=Legionella nautarum TaxID=45070 RepID=A0A0W0WKV5_9GAMM|nr:copper oxidase [Legionella nautarum]KTD32962.1 multicopper oxidase [Legionella nautarum]